MLGGGSDRMRLRVIGSLPIAFAATVFLGARWVHASVACFGEVAGEVLLGSCGAVGEADVVTVVALVSACHY